MARIDVKERKVDFVAMQKEWMSKNEVNKCVTVVSYENNIHRKSNTIAGTKNINGFNSRRFNKLTENHVCVICRSPYRPAPVMNRNGYSIVCESCRPVKKHNNTMYDMVKILKRQLKELDIIEENVNTKSNGTLNEFYETFETLVCISNGVYASKKLWVVYNIVKDEIQLRVNLRIVVKEETPKVFDPNMSVTGHKFDF